MALPLKLLRNYEIISSKPKSNKIKSRNFIQENIQKLKSLQEETCRNNKSNHSKNNFKNSIQLSQNKNEISKNKQNLKSYNNNNTSNSSRNSNLSTNKNHFKNKKRKHYKSDYYEINDDYDDSDTSISRIENFTQTIDIREPTFFDNIQILKPSQHIQEQINEERHKKLKDLSKLKKLQNVSGKEHIEELKEFFEKGYITSRKQKINNDIQQDIHKRLDESDILMKSGKFRLSKNTKKRQEQQFDKNIPPYEWKNTITHHPRRNLQENVRLSSNEIPCSHRHHTGRNNDNGGCGDGCNNSHIDDKSLIVLFERKWKQNE